jgi:hypothetical protein
MEQVARDYWGAQVARFHFGLLFHLACCSIWPAVPFGLLFHLAWDRGLAMERPSGKLRRLTLALFESSGTLTRSPQDSLNFVLGFMLFMLKRAPFFGSFWSTGGDFQCLVRGCQGHQAPSGVVTRGL